MTDILKEEGREENGSSRRNAPMVLQTSKSVPIPVRFPGNRSPK